MLAAGSRVAITARSAPELYDTAAQLNSAADQIVAIPADATDPVAAPEIVAKVEQRLGPITLLINNAGQIRAFGLIETVDPAAWWNEVEVTTHFRARVPTARLRKAEKVLARLGMKPGDAFNMFLAQVELRDDLPFAITTHPEGLLSTGEQGKVWEEALGEY